MIYEAQNIINKKRYIGYTSGALEDRKIGHLKSLRGGSQTHFHRALRKYGTENFIWKVVDKTLDISKENDYITKYNTITEGYNMTQGGTGGDTISMKSPEEKKRQGAKSGHKPWNTGKKITGELYDKMYVKRKTRRELTDDEKLTRGKKASKSILSSKKYYDGIKNREITGRQYQVKRLSDGKIWSSQKQCLTELQISQYIFYKKLGKELIKVTNGQNKL